MDVLCSQPKDEGPMMGVSEGEVWDLLSCGDQSLFKCIVNGVFVMIFPSSCLLSCWSLHRSTCIRWVVSSDYLRWTIRGNFLWIIYCGSIKLSSCWSCFYFLSHFDCLKMATGTFWSRVCGCLLKDMLMLLTFVLPRITCRGRWSL